MLQGDRDGDDLRGVHQLGVEPAVLVRRPASADDLLRDHVHVVVQPADEGLEERGAADPDGRVPDRGLGRVAGRPLDQHLLRDRPDRTRTQGDVGHREDRGTDEGRHQEAGHRSRQPEAPRAAALLGRALRRDRRQR